MEKRESRRDRTWRAARRQQLIRLRSCFGLDRWSTKGTYYYAKRTALGCRCTGRHPGSPKTGTGCCMGGPRPAWVERVKGNRMVRAWMKALREGVAPDDLEG